MPLDVSINNYRSAPLTSTPPLTLFNSSPSYTADIVEIVKQAASNKLASLAEATNGNSKIDYGFQVIVGFFLIVSSIAIVICIIYCCIADCDRRRRATATSSILAVAQSMRNSCKCGSDSCSIVSETSSVKRNRKKCCHDCERIQKPRGPAKQIITVDSISRPIRNKPTVKYANHIRAAPPPLLQANNENDDHPLPPPPPLSPPPAHSSTRKELLSKALSDGQLAFKENRSQFGEFNGRKTKRDAELFISLDEEIRRAKKLLIVHGYMRTSKPHTSGIQNRSSINSGISSKSFYSFPISEDISEDISDP